MVLKHSHLINGYDSLNLTKLDVLDQLADIKVAVGYKLDGKELEGFPGEYVLFPSVPDLTDFPSRSGASFQG